MATNLPDAPLHLPTNHPAWLDWFVTIRSIVSNSSQVANVAVGFVNQSGGSVTSSYSEMAAISVDIDSTLPNTKLVGFVSMKIFQSLTGTVSAKVDINDGSGIERGFTGFKGVGDLVFPFVYQPGAGTHDIALWAKSSASGGATISIPSIMVFRFGAS